MTDDVGMPGHWLHQLDDGERVLWQGAPMPGIRNLRFRALITLVGLGLIAVGFGTVASGFPDAIRTARLDDVVGVAIGVALMMFGVYCAILQWFDAALAHRMTRYTLTNRRAFILLGSGGFSDKASYRILPETAIELDRRKGYCDLWFYVRPKQVFPETAPTKRVGFEGIADGEKVFMLLRSIQMGTA